MTMTDPIADMLTRIQMDKWQNCQVSMPSSKSKVAIIQLLARRVY